LSDYIACISDHPNKICNKNNKKNIRGSMISTRVTRHQCAHPQQEGITLRKGNPKVREEAKVGDQEDLTLRRETLRRERRPKLETWKERRA
jgi:hypothetical protein